MPVCALGAMAYAHIVRKNACTTISFKNGWQTDISMMLSDIFEKDQLALIEAAFEQTDIDSACTLAGLSDAEERDAEEFRDGQGCEYNEDDPSALRLIMQNIIDNKGTFKP